MKIDFLKTQYGDLEEIICPHKFNFLSFDIEQEEKTSGLLYTGDFWTTFIYFNECWLC